MLKKLQKIFKIKKIFFLIFFVLSISNNGVAENFDRNNDLNKLFTQLKNTKNLSSAKVLEKKNMGNLVSSSFR